MFSEIPLETSDMARSEKAVWENVSINPRTEAEMDAESWTVWCEFCDEAKVGPDTTLTPDELAARYTGETGITVLPKIVKRLMPETP